MCVVMGAADDTYDGIAVANDALAFIVFVALGIATALFISYMNSVPTEKKCILLYLYQDAISSVLWMWSVTMVKSILGYWITEGTSKVQAITVCFALMCGGFYMTLTVFLISIYKLLMAKTKTIDPEIPFLSGDEISAIRKIRIGSLLIVLGFLSTTFAMGWYPNSIYTMMPDEVGCHR